MDIEKLYQHKVCLANRKNGRGEYLQDSEKAARHGWRRQNKGFFPVNSQF
jgi:hypothetical protein